MTTYILRRLLLMIPTLFGIMVLNFIIIQAAPGGPVEQAIARFKGTGVDATARFSGGGSVNLNNPSLASSGSGSSTYRGAQGIDPELIARLEKEYGFDKPMWERFWQMMGRYARFDFGQSFYRDRSVIDLVMEKLPVSISLGIWTTLLTYFIAIPLGIRKAVHDGSHFDVWSSTAIIIGYAIPSFLFAILLIVLFAGGGYVQWFPLRGLVSENWDVLPWPQKIIDYLWHMVLPVTAMLVGSFASLTMLTKNSFLEEIRKTYVLTARAKGISEHRVLYGHVFRNAMLIVIAGFPSALVRMLFTGALLIEVIFSLDGLGLLGFESAMNRDYPVMFGTLYVFTLLGLVLGLLGDLMYVAIDPRIDFEGRAA
ncbi:MAG: microcin C ABC transporter permease YejB [Alphaproteobacteria bacterium]|nr:microcin C ABC transporter permease YejB [Alphaproteobacteria bacterium]